MGISQKSDIELMAMMVELEQQGAKINQALNAVKLEIMKRIEEFKKKDNKDS